MLTTLSTYCAEQVIIEPSAYWAYACFIIDRSWRPYQYLLALPQLVAGSNFASCLLQTPCGSTHTLPALMDKARRCRLSTTQTHICWHPCNYICLIIQIRMNSHSYSQPPPRFVACCMSGGGPPGEEYGQQGHQQQEAPGNQLRQPGTLQVTRGSAGFWMTMRNNHHLC